MPKRKYPHTVWSKDRNGNKYWYFRVGHGPRTRLPDPYDSLQFKKAHAELLAKHMAGLGEVKRTLAWLIEQYQESPKWQNAAKESRKQFKYQFAKMIEKAGKAPLSEITTESIVMGRDSRAGKPSDANKYLKASRAIFLFAVERGYCRTNPAQGVGKLASRGSGFHTWTEDEAQRFESFWPVGCRERLAFDLLVFTGVRRSDVVRLGRQHTRGGEITIKTEKSVNMGHPVEVTITLLQPLAKSIEATKTGDLTFLVTAAGTPFKKESFGNWFRKACKAAGVPGSSHGLRKLAAVRMAENGASEAELNAVFGWSDGSKEAAAYIKKANRAKIGRKGANKMLPVPESPTESPTKIIPLK